MIKSNSLLNHSNDISLNQLIGLLDGNINCCKRKWYARNSWLRSKSDELTEEAFKYLNKSDFDKRNLSYQKIIEKQALIQHLQTEFIILRAKIQFEFENIENCQTFKRFSLDYKEKDFIIKFDRLIKRLENEIKKYIDIISLENTDKLQNEISFADSITDILISINGGMIDKNTITAKDFYIQLENYKRKNTKQNGK